MKILIIIALFIIVAVSFSYAQTAVKSTTTIDSISNLKPGAYYFLVGADTTYFNKDTALTITVHVPLVCPVCKVFTKADTVAIQALKVCPPPIICPICPVIPPQRTAVGITWDIILNKKIVTYQDGTTTTL